MTVKLDQGQILLEQIKSQIISLLQEREIEAAQIFMEQYINLAPHTMDRYSLEAMINTKKGDLHASNEILLEGVKHHPLSFDLLYNLGYTFQHLNDPLEAYNFYMKAKYVAKSEDEKSDIYEALKSLGDDFSGYSTIDKKNTFTIIGVGKLELTLKQSHDELAARKELVHTIATNTVEDADEILEIGFEDGAIARNLNFFGYNVTAVDPIKEKIIEVILRDWHGNILQPEEKSAKFYQENVNLEWIGRIPNFDIIIAVAKDNINRFQAYGKEKTVLNQLIGKSKKQLIIRVAKELSDKEFTKKVLLDLVEEKGIHWIKVGAEEEGGDVFEIYSITKIENPKLFSIPRPTELIKQKSSVIEIETSKCTDSYGAGYIEDFHPFVEVLKQYEKNHDLKYSDSILKKYYDTFQPQNLEEGLFAGSKNLPRLKRGWIGYPWLWTSDKKVIFTDKTLDTRPGGNHFYGPNTEDFGKGELSRLKSLYESLKIQGYQPEMFFDGYISGYLLLKGSDYRFVVTEGQHRIAALAALGYKKILCKFSQKPEYNNIVDLENIKKWSQVENKTYSINLARRVFLRFFEEGVGRDRMISK